MAYDERGRVFVRGNDTTLEVTPTLDTGAYTSADLLFACKEIPNAVLMNGDTLLLMSIDVIDGDAMGLPMDLHFFSGSVNAGTANGACILTSALALKHLGYVSVGTADFATLGSAKVATVPQVGLQLTVDSDSKSLWMVGVTGGTPTHTAAGLQFNLGVIR